MPGGDAMEQFLEWWYNHRRNVLQCSTTGQQESDNHHDVEKVTPAEFEGTGRGLMATRDLVQGELLLQVPQSLLLTSHAIAAQQNPIWAHLVAISHGRDASIPHQQTIQPVPLMCLFLLFQKHVLADQSPWNPFLRILPSQFSLLVNFTIGELKQLQNPLLIEKALRHKRTVATMYHKQVVPLLEQHSEMFTPRSAFCFEEFLWAYCVIESRGCYFDVNAAAGDIVALVPFGDFFNFSTLPCECKFNPVSRCFEFCASRNYSKGEEVFICYGRHDNFKLLKHYGFVLGECNKFNRIRLTFDQVLSVYRTVETRHKLIQKKETLLQQAKLGSGLFLHCENDEMCDSDSDSLLSRVSWNLAACLRIIMMSNEELQHSFVALQGGIVSERNELKATQYLRFLCDEQLRAFETTVEQDESLLRLEGGSPHTRLAIRQRCADKRLLISIREWAVLRTDSLRHACNISSS